MKWLFPVVVLALFAFFSMSIYSKDKAAAEKQENERRMQAMTDSYTSGFDGLMQNVRSK